MSKLLSTGQCRIALQVCAAGLMAALMSGCSSDASRMGDPFGNPFASASNDTAPVRQHVASSDVIPAGRTPPVSSQALAPRAASMASASGSAPHSSVAFREPISRETTGSIESGPTRIAAGPSFGGWTSSGGTPIQVAEGENADVLSKRYGVPANALLQVNGLRSGADVRPGARIVIPVYGASAGASRVAEAPRQERIADARPVMNAGRDPANATVTHHAARERLLTPAPARVATSGRPAQTLVAPRQAAEAQQVTSRSKVAVLNGKHVRPGMAPVATRVLVAPAKVAEAPVARRGVTAPTAQVVTKPNPLRMAVMVPAKTAIPLKATVSSKAVPAVEVPRPIAQATPAPVAPSPAPAPTVVATNDPASPEFRWPARGRIIQSFKGGSGGNDGINIALPEGTSVKAAEGGVVAYAGSELKGYGNLVLIRHPNGFVSAYANNGTIDVKRGETVKRGQEIAKSGQSGNVSSPQLHFELRKGSTPVDPTQFLAGL